MNETIKLLHNHRSIRKFTPEKLTKEEVRTIVEAGQRASTSSNVMAYSIIGITDENIKKELRKVSGQPYVENNGYLFVICADLSRIANLDSDAVHENVKQNLESTEQFIVATVDGALVTQNMVIAAEALGFGACYLGSLRNDINRVDELLKLPEYVIPLFGLAVGHPDHEPNLKPRLPFEAVFHENTYQQATHKHVESYDRTISDYYQARDSNLKDDNWSKQMLRKYKIPTRIDVAAYVQSKNINKQ
ncbi:oxygen-insensitive NADPH nitroreductase [Oceanobacillus alkalisoli]|uniref:oxygen-insensitive NADPH nitroreductase n=1 Tax=Oceanobacillus alkalisoli TaxID=2925113 RepID=UPI001EEFCF50|nr:oxygen-insensitive NADPH nitroreductase [Oceanobacillus alkalisoli]MCF3944757.1 oxygen-insensitive NADPH nitroreductase [Oceanobacillus alkalisoli]MCG5104361.1 oxygen-insensitive NADPH nitroreductase [Oceanobacillus alkalisoli]